MLAWRAAAALWLSGQANAFQPGTIELTVKHHLPVMVTQRVDVEAGGLISHFPDYAELARDQYQDRTGSQPGRSAIAVA